MIARISAVIAFASCMIGVATIDRDSIIPLVLILLGAGVLIGILICNWDWLVREYDEQYDDVDQLLWREKNKW